MVAMRVGRNNAFSNRCGFAKRCNSREADLGHPLRAAPAISQEAEGFSSVPSVSGWMIYGCA
jgi:hypothetical protein